MVVASNSIPEQVLILQKLQRRRRLIRAALVATAVALAAASFFLYEEVASRWRYSAAAQLADRSDPGWRHNAIEASRGPVSSTRNSATVLLEADRLLGEQHPGAALSEGIGVPPLESATWLPPERLAQTRAALASMAPALEKARSLADFPDGRYDIDWSKGFLSQNVRHPAAMHRIARWLSLDAAVRARDGDIDGALRSAKAILNTARSVGEEPLFASQLTRLKLGMAAVSAIEQALAHGVASGPVLLDLQAALQEELEFPHALIGLRGERAAIDHVFGAIIDGEYDGGKLFTPLQGPGPYLLFSTRTFRDNRAWLLTRMTLAVEAAKSSELERADRLRQFDAAITREFRQQGYLELMRFFPARSVLPSCYAISENNRQHNALLRCAITAIGAERNRLAHGRLSQTLEEFEQDLPAKSAVDPYTLGPLHVKTLDDGVLVYSFGVDRADNGGARGTGQLYIKGTDIAFHLRDVAHRRQAANSQAELPRDVFQSLSP
jgi:hypothetical protein